MNKALKVIGIIELGGTISSICESPTSEFYKGPSASVSSLINEFNLKDIEIRIEKLTEKISHELTIPDLINLANKISNLLNQEEYYGVVVTCGTNALEDIAYFIGLAVSSMKPIIFTGSHYPQNSLSFDGKRNLFNALKIASSNKAISLGVLVTFNNYVVTAREAVKTTPGLINNFSIEGNGVVGHVIGEEFILKSKPVYRHTYQSEFSTQGKSSLPDISIIYGHLGMNDFLIQASINAGVSGIISAGFGKGYQPRHISLALAKAVALGIPVVRCSRSGCGYTSIDHDYDKKYGFIVAKGLSPHKSSILLSLALTITTNIEKIQHIFEEY